MGVVSTDIYRPLTEDEVYVKVGNFWYARVNEKVLLILNAGDYHSYDADGVHMPVLQAGCPGGSARIFDLARLEQLGASGFCIESDGTMDAKFILPRTSLLRVAKIFSVKNKSNTFECFPDREIDEEFFREVFPDRCDLPILALNHRGKIKSSHRGTFVYETPRTTDAGHNVHIVRAFDLNIPRDVIRKMLEVKKAVYLATRDEMKNRKMIRGSEEILISRKAQFIDGCIRGTIPLAHMGVA